MRLGGAPWFYHCMRILQLLYWIMEDAVLLKLYLALLSLHLIMQFIWSPYYRVHINCKVCGEKNYEHYSRVKKLFKQRNYKSLIYSSNHTVLGSIKVCFKEQYWTTLFSYIQPYHLPAFTFLWWVLQNESRWKMGGMDTLLLWLSTWGEPLKGTGSERYKNININQ